MNEISSKQLYIMIFFIPLVFKMSSLPALFYGQIEASAYLLIGIIVAIEFSQLLLVLFISKEGGMNELKKRYGNAVYCLVSLPILFVIFMKMLLFVQEIVFYLCSFFFYNIEEFAIMAVIIVAIIYLGTRGAKIIGRMFELAIWLVGIIIIFGLFFGQVELNTMYLTPVFDNSIQKYFGVAGKYLIYTFDFSPLLFFNVKVKKVSPVVLCSVLSTATVMLGYALLYSSYGNASMHADFGFARLATFNTVISEIGSLDWPSVVLWLIAGILSLALKVNAVNQIFEGLKLKKFGTAIFCVAVMLVLQFAVKTLPNVVKLVTNGVQYAVFGIEVGLPLLILLLFALKKQGGEYATQN